MVYWGGEGGGVGNLKHKEGHGEDPFLPEHGIGQATVHPDGKGSQDPVGRGERRGGEGRKGPATKSR